jgi:hypothetical protein
MHHITSMHDHVLIRTFQTNFTEFLAQKSAPAAMSNCAVLVSPCLTAS